MDIIKLAEEYKIPLIADEVYFGIVKEGYEHHPFASLTKTLPILAISSISKVYLVPGWRLGWVIAYNRSGYFDLIIKNLDQYQKIHYPPASILQYALPKIFARVPDSYFKDFNTKLFDKADYLYTQLSTIDALKPLKSNASMFLMVGIDFSKLRDISDDLDFSLKLYEE